MTDQTKAAGGNFPGMPDASGGYVSRAGLDDMLFDRTTPTVTRQSAKKMVETSISQLYDTLHNAGERALRDIVQIGTNASAPADYAVSPTVPPMPDAGKYSWTRRLLPLAGTALLSGGATFGTLALLNKLRSAPKNEKKEASVFDLEKAAELLAKSAVRGRMVREVQHNVAVSRVKSAVVTPVIGGLLGAIGAPDKHRLEGYARGSKRGVGTGLGAAGGMLAGGLAGGLLSAYLPASQEGSMAYLRDALRNAGLGATIGSATGALAGGATGYALSADGLPTWSGGDYDPVLRNSHATAGAVAPAAAAGLLGGAVGGYHYGLPGFAAGALLAGVPAAVGTHQLLSKYLPEDSGDGVIEPKAASLLGPRRKKNEPPIPTVSRAGAGLLGAGAGSYLLAKGIASDTQTKALQDAIKNNRPAGYSDPTQLPPNQTGLTHYQATLSPAAQLRPFGIPVGRLMTWVRSKPELLDALGVGKGTELTEDAVKGVSGLPHYNSFSQGPVPAYFHQLKARLQNVPVPAELQGGGNQSYPEWMGKKLEDFIRLNAGGVHPMELNPEIMSNADQLKLMESFHASLPEAEKAFRQTTESPGAGYVTQTNDYLGKAKPLLAARNALKTTGVALGGAGLGALAGHSLYDLFRDPKEKNKTGRGLAAATGAGLGGAGAFFAGTDTGRDLMWKGLLQGIRSGRALPGNIGSLLEKAKGYLPGVKAASDKEARWGIPESISSLGTSALEYAKKNPAEAGGIGGAALGAGIGAAGGFLGRPKERRNVLGDALTGAIAGGAAGGGLGLAYQMPQTRALLDKLKEMTTVTPRKIPEKTDNAVIDALDNVPGLSPPKQDVKSVDELMNARQNLDEWAAGDSWLSSHRAKLFGGHLLYESMPFKIFGTRPLAKELLDRVLHKYTGDPSNPENPIWQRTLKGLQAGPKESPLTMHANSEELQPALRRRIANLERLQGSVWQRLFGSGPRRTSRPAITLPGSPASPGPTPRIPTGLLDSQGRPIFRPGTPGPGTPATPPTLLRPAISLDSLAQAVSRGSPKKDTITAGLLDRARNTPIGLRRIGAHAALQLLVDMAASSARKSIADRHKLNLTHQVTQ